jgi:hypothetical protein
MRRKSDARDVCGGDRWEAKSGLVVCGRCGKVKNPSRMLDAGGKDICSGCYSSGASASAAMLASIQINQSK